MIISKVIERLIELKQEVGETKVIIAFIDGDGFYHKAQIDEIIFSKSNVVISSNEN